MFLPKPMGTATRAVVILVGFSIKYRQDCYSQYAKVVKNLGPKEASPHDIVDIVAHSEHNGCIRLVIRLGNRNWKGPSHQMARLAGCC